MYLLRANQTEEVDECCVTRFWRVWGGRQLLVACQRANKLGVPSFKRIYFGPTTHTEEDST